MTPQERRGRRLFLVLATVIVLEKLAGVALALSGGPGEVRWLRSVAQPAGFAAAVVFLWQGDVWLRWLVGVTCVVSGGVSAVVFGRVLLKLAEITPPEAAGGFLRVAGYPIGLVCVIGLLYLLAGLLILFSPNIRAFLRYQREGAGAA